MKELEPRKGRFAVIAETFLYYSGSEQIVHEQLTLPYQCGYCHQQVQGIVLAKHQRGGRICWWCICSDPDCEKPTVIHADPAEPGGGTYWPPPIFRPIHENWPEKMKKLFLEASRAFSIEAYTACVLVCRRVLMDIARDKGCPEKKYHIEYEKYVLTQVLNPAILGDAGKADIEQMRRTGNEGAHELAIINRETAARSLAGLANLLTVAYALARPSQEEPTDEKP